MWMQSKSIFILNRGLINVSSAIEGLGESETKVLQTSL